MQFSTGLTGLDKVLKGLMAGDNIVWQVDSIDDYIPLVRPYAETAVAQGRKIVYFRFAKHEPLIPLDTDGPFGEVDMVELDPEQGFEAFIGAIHATIEQGGRGAYYIFDCLSDLAVDWYSDRMVGNFFMLTCPYLYDLETITYFGLFRDYHSIHATAPIAETTQLLLDVFRHKNKLFIQPLKVQHRYSPTMHMLHVWENDTFRPVTESYVVAEVLGSTTRSPLDSASSRLGVWNRNYLLAESFVLQKAAGGPAEPARENQIFEHLLRMMFSRDERVLSLASKYFALEDLVSIGKRMIGTGLIGGKSVGMLLARAILKRHDPRWKNLLEPHDSFYIGSDVFYTYLVRNGCWWVRQKQKNPRTFLEGAETGRQRILTGTFPDYIARQFEDMLDYFGQSPIIVRSSSLLEDNFGNAFAGKYDSVFCANQGSRHKRLEDFLSAVRTVYASSMSEKALTYRARRSLLDCDEQMGLLIQRVSGGIHGSYYFPQVAGVGFSFNSYVWSEFIDPKAGVLRLVFGLGTRAVDRSDDDYTRLVALNAPERRPESDAGKMREHVQRKVDVIDLEGNLVVSTDFGSAIDQSQHPKGGTGIAMDFPIDLFATRDDEAERARRGASVYAGHQAEPQYLLTFDGLLTNTSFVDDTKEMLRVLQDAYDYPVDVEFTANFGEVEPGEPAFRINLVQCRPLQVKGSTTVTDPPESIPAEDIIFRTRGPVIGQSRIETVDRIIYVVPATYGQLPVKERYTIARIIGQICHQSDEARMAKQAVGETFSQMLLGPGRWGTTTPSLGVPVSFAEINTISSLCEIVAMRENLVPDVSLGTHFFSDLVEMDVLYLALFPHREESILNDAFFENMPNKLVQLVPRASAYGHIIKVIDTAEMPGNNRVRFNANTLKQRVVCYLEK